MAKKNANVMNGTVKVGIPTEDKILYTVINVIMVLWLAIVLFPVIFIIASSFSSFLKFVLLTRIVAFSTCQTPLYQTQSCC